MKGGMAHPAEESIRLFRCQTVYLRLERVLALALISGQEMMVSFHAPLWWFLSHYWWK